MKKQRDFISVSDLTRKEIEKIFKLTDKLKGRKTSILKNKNFALLFAKPSTRTRVSFEVGINDLGGNPIYLDLSTTQLGRGETIGDTGKTLSRYVDCIIARLFSHNDMIELAKSSTIPVINALDDLLHPCQALSDMYTIKEKLGRLKGLNLTYLGDGNNNVTHSLMIACSKLGLNMIVSCPKTYKPNKDIMKIAPVEIVSDPENAVKNADIIYTDVWVSMGREKEIKQRLKLLKPYQVNKRIVSLAKKDVLVMHCLPAHRGQEITDDVIDGKNSIVFDQAENRLHVQKGILGLLF